jgi:hypothetical protein
MTKGLRKNRDGLLEGSLFTVDRPLPVLPFKGTGHGGIDGVPNQGFANRKGKFVFTLNFDVDPRVESIELAREGHDNGSRDRDERRAVLGVEMDRNAAFRLAMFLLETVREYDDAYPSTGRSTGSPNFRSRSL